MKKILITSISTDSARLSGYAVNDLAEFDTFEVISKLENTLIELKYSVCSIYNNEDFNEKINVVKPDLVWNINSGLLGKNREAYIPMFCEYSDLKFTGSGSWTAFITQDKYLCYQILKKQMPEILIPKSILITQSDNIVIKFIEVIT